MCVGSHFVFFLLFVFRKCDRIIARVSNVPVRICMSCVFWHHQHCKIFSVHVRFYVDSFAVIFNALTNTHFHGFDLSYHHSRKRNDRFVCLCFCVSGFFFVSFHSSLFFSSCIFWHSKSHSLFIIAWNWLLLSLLLLCFIQLWMRITFQSNYLCLFFIRKVAAPTANNLFKAFVCEAIIAWE